MSPQFVDFDHDGRLDIVAGIFDGSPHVAYATGRGWRQPEQILDRDGQRIVLNQFWNFETEKWDVTKRCDPDGYELPEGHGTSAYAWDWDGDGDLDLLLGDYDGGRLYRRMNEGKPGEPRFALENEPVQAAGAPLEVPHKTATPRMIDWDRDGLLDLVCGSMGDCWNEDEGGAVYLYRNSGAPGAPRFDGPVVLVEPSRKGHVGGPVRPDAGLYMDVGDFEGDGDFDLVVGGYSMWKPEPPVLSQEQQARVPVLQAEMKEVSEKTEAIFEAIQKAMEGLAEDEAGKKSEELFSARQAELSELRERQKAIGEELDPLIGSPKRVAYVWLYENQAARPGRSAAGR
jgi:hypothetical protein